MAGKAEDIIEQYQRLGPKWSQQRPTKLLEKSWLDCFLEALPKNSHILDLGCGAGKPIAEYFIIKQMQVTGVDSASSMISLSQEAHPNATWIKQDMRTLSLGKSFDGIIAWNSFFHLTHTDQRLMFSLFKEHAAPGCRLMFTSGTGHGEAIGNLCGERLYHASLAKEEYHAQLNENGFEVLMQTDEDPDCYEQTVWLAEYKG